MSTAARMLRYALLGMVTGVLASLAAIAFVDLVLVLNDWLLISPRSRFMQENAGLLLAATVLVPAGGGLIVGMVHRHIPERRAHGPPDVIRAVQGSEGRVPLRSGFLSALTSVVSLGAGASVGQYGPLSHLGATLGSLVVRLYPPAERTPAIWVGCGVAAAISTAFNAPIAGIVFAHEVMLRHYSLRAFAPITVAATIGHVVANVVFERPPLFRVEPMSVSSPMEFLAFIVIGIGGAFVAVLYMRTILWSSRMAQGIPIAAHFKPMLAGALLGFAALGMPDILGIGKETLRFAIIDQAYTAGELAALLFAKILATALCIGFGFAGGVFSPALLTGILFGALAGNGAELMIGALHSDIAVYAICGMVAVASAVIGAPLTTILIVFELTRNYDLATAAMVSVVFSNLVSYRIFGRSLFDVQLRMRGFDLSAGRDKVILERALIKRYITRDYIALAPDTSLAHARARLLKARRHEGQVVAADGTWLGAIVLADIVDGDDRGAGGATDVARLARRDGLSFTPETSVWSAMEELGDYIGESIPVLEEDGGTRLRGVVFEATIVRAYLDITQGIRSEEHAAG